MRVNKTDLNPSSISLPITDGSSVAVLLCLRVNGFICDVCCVIVPYLITETCLYKFNPLKPHFYLVKLGFTGVYIIFLISAQKHRLWVLVITAFLSENFQFLEV